MAHNHNPRPYRTLWHVCQNECQSSVLSKDWYSQSVNAYKDTSTDINTLDILSLSDNEESDVRAIRGDRNCVRSSHFGFCEPYKSALMTWC